MPIRASAAVIIGLLCGALAFVLLWSGWHLWVDHARMHLAADQVDIWRAAAIQQQQQQQAIPK